MESLPCEESKVDQVSDGSVPCKKARQKVEVPGDVMMHLISRQKRQEDKQSESVYAGDPDADDNAVYIDKVKKIGPE